jgi:hypothetical protein
LLVLVPVEGIRVVDEAPQDLRGVGGGHDKGLLDAVVEDQLYGELAMLKLALMGEQLAIGALLRRFPRARLPVAPETETLGWRRGMFRRGLERLPLVL